MSETNGSHLDIEVISALIDGALPAAEAEAAEAHLASCAICQAERAELERTVHTLRALPAARPPRSFRVDAAAIPPDVVTPPVPSRVVEEEVAAPRLRPVPVTPRRVGPGPGLLRALAGVAAGLMVMLFIADAFVPYRSPSGAAGYVTAAGGAAPAPAASQAQRREAAPALAPADHVASGPAAEPRGAPGGGSAGANIAAGDAAPPAAAEPAAPVSPRVTGGSSVVAGVGTAPVAAQADAAKAAPAPAVTAPQAYPRDTLRPLHVGSLFGLFAFLLGVASIVAARRAARISPP